MSYCSRNVTIFNRHDDYITFGMVVIADSRNYDGHHYDTSGMMMMIMLMTNMMINIMIMISGMVMVIMDNAYHDDHDDGEDDSLLL